MGKKLQIQKISDKALNQFTGSYMPDIETQEQLARISQYDYFLSNFKTQQDIAEYKNYLLHTQFSSLGLVSPFRQTSDFRAIFDTEADLENYLLTPEDKPEQKIFKKIGQSLVSYDGSLPEPSFLQDAINNFSMTAGWARWLGDTAFEHKASIPNLSIDDEGGIYFEGKVLDLPDEYKSTIMEYQSAISGGYKKRDTWDKVGIQAVGLAFDLPLFIATGLVTAKITAASTILSNLAKSTDLISKTISRMVSGGINFNILGVPQTAEGFKTQGVKGALESIYHNTTIGMLSGVFSQTGTSLGKLTGRFFLKNSPAFRDEMFGMVSSGGFGYALGKISGETDEEAIATGLSFMATHFLAPTALHRVVSEMKNKKIFIGYENVRGADPDYFMRENSLLYKINKNLFTQEGVIEKVPNIEPIKVTDANRDNFVSIVRIPELTKVSFRQALVNERASIRAEELYQKMIKGLDPEYVVKNKEGLRSLAEAVVVSSIGSKLGKVFSRWKLPEDTELDNKMIKFSNDLEIPYSDVKKFVINNISDFLSDPEGFYAKMKGVSPPKVADGLNDVMEATVAAFEKKSYQNQVPILSAEQAETPVKAPKDTKEYDKYEVKGKEVEVEPVGGDKVKIRDTEIVFTPKQSGYKKVKGKNLYVKDDVVYFRYGDETYEGKIESFTDEYRRANVKVGEETYNVDVNDITKTKGRVKDAKEEVQRIPRGTEEQVPGVVREESSVGGIKDVEQVSQRQTDILSEEGLKTAEKPKAEEELGKEGSEALKKSSQANKEAQGKEIKEGLDISIAPEIPKSPKRNIKELGAKSNIINDLTTEISKNIRYLGTNKGKSHVNEAVTELKRLADEANIKDKGKAQNVKHFMVNVLSAAGLKASEIAPVLRMSGYSNMEVQDVYNSLKKKNQFKRVVSKIVLPKEVPSESAFADFLQSKLGADYLSKLEKMSSEELNKLQQEYEGTKTYYGEEIAEKSQTVVKGRVAPEEGVLGIREQEKGEIYEQAGMSIQQKTAETEQARLKIIHKKADEVEEYLKKHKLDLANDKDYVKAYRHFNNDEVAKVVLNVLKLKLDPRDVSDPTVRELTLFSTIRARVGMSRGELERKVAELNEQFTQYNVKVEISEVPQVDVDPGYVRPGVTLVSKEGIKILLDPRWASYDTIAHEKGHAMLLLAENQKTVESVLKRFGWDGDYHSQSFSDAHEKFLEDMSRYKPKNKVIQKIKETLQKFANFLMGKGFYSESEFIRKFAEGKIKMRKWAIDSNHEFYDRIYGKQDITYFLKTIELIKENETIILDDSFFKRLKKGGIKDAEIYFIRQLLRTLGLSGKIKGSELRGMIMEHLLPLRLEEYRAGGGLGPDFTPYDYSSYYTFDKNIGLSTLFRGWGANASRTYDILEEHVDPTAYRNLRRRYSGQDVAEVYDELFLPLVRKNKDEFIRNFEFYRLLYEITHDPRIATMPDIQLNIEAYELFIREPMNFWIRFDEYRALSSALENFPYFAKMVENMLIMHRRADTDVKKQAIEEFLLDLGVLGRHADITQTLEVIRGDFEEGLRSIPEPIKEKYREYKNLEHRVLLLTVPKKYGLRVTQHHDYFDHPYELGWIRIMDNIKPELKSLNVLEIQSQYQYVNKFEYVPYREIFSSKYDGRRLYEEDIEHLRSLSEAEYERKASAYNRILATPLMEQGVWSPFINLSILSSDLSDALQQLSAALNPHIENFQVKTILQYAASNDYSFVRFPKGETVSLIQGHTRQIKNAELDLSRGKERLRDAEYRLKETLKRKWKIEQKIQTDPGTNLHRTASLHKALEAIRAVEDDYRDDALRSRGSVLREQEIISQLKEMTNRIQRLYDDIILGHLKKIKKDVRVVRDEFGNEWYETSITPQDKGAIALFQTVKEKQEFSDDLQKDIQEYMEAIRSIEMGAVLKGQKFYDYVKIQKELYAKKNELGQRLINNPFVRKLSKATSKLYQSAIQTNNYAYQVDENGNYSHPYARRAYDIVSDEIVTKVPYQINSILKDKRYWDGGKPFRSLDNSSRKDFTKRADMTEKLRKYEEDIALGRKEPPSIKTDEQGKPLETLEQAHRRIGKMIGWTDEQIAVDWKTQKTYQEAQRHAYHGAVDYFVTLKDADGLYNATQALKVDELRSIFNFSERLEDTAVYEIAKERIQLDGDARYEVAVTIADKLYPEFRNTTNPFYHNSVRPTTLNTWVIRGYKPKYYTKEELEDMHTNKLRQIYSNMTNEPVSEMKGVSREETLAKIRELQSKLSFGDEYPLYTYANSEREMNETVQYWNDKGFLITKTYNIGEYVAKKKYSSLTAKEILDLANRGDIPVNNEIIKQLLEAVQAGRFEQHYLAKNYVLGLHGTPVEYETLVTEFAHQAVNSSTRVYGLKKLRDFIAEANVDASHKLSVPTYSEAEKSKIKEELEWLEQFYNQVAFSDKLPVIDRIRELATTYYIGFKPSFWIQQIFQPLQIALSESMAEIKNGQSKWTDAFVTALKLAYEIKARKNGETTNGINEELWQLYDYMDKANKMGALGIEELTGRSPDIDLHYGSNLYKGWKSYVKIANLGGAVVEKFTRLQSLAMWYDIGKAKGLTGEKLRQYIVRKHDEVMSLWGASGRPVIGSPKSMGNPQQKILKAILKSFFTFKTFTMANLGQYDRLIRRKQWGALGVKTMVGLGLHGAFNFPLLATLFALTNLFTEDDMEYEALRALDELNMEGVGRGLLTSVTGINFTNLFDERTAYATDVYSEMISKSVENRLLQTMLGAPYAVTHDIIKGSKAVYDYLRNMVDSDSSITEKERKMIYNNMAKMTPLSVRNIIRAMKMDEDGVELRGETIIKSEDLTWSDVFYKILGFNTLNIAKAYEEQFHGLPAKWSRLNGKIRELRTIIKEINQDKSYSLEEKRIENKKANKLLKELLDERQKMKKSQGFIELYKKGLIKL
ncbi:hypothetical protein [Ignavibacterium sp.]|uniref:hypothetical protein n=1 Tax=Ignavibacterium sp. TaxID=2651167 RepID=UPI00307FBFBA